jgi:hypothetical protein
VNRISRKAEPRRPVTVRIFWGSLWCGVALLVGCGTSSREVPVQVAGGQAIQLPRRGQAFRVAENSLVAVTNAGLTVVDQDGNKYLRWAFSLRLKKPAQLRSVRVEEVSGPAAVLLVNDQAPVTELNQWTGSGGLIEASATGVPWLFGNSDTTQVFRLTITDMNGQSYVLYQGEFFSAKKKAEMRKQFGVT